MQIVEATDASVRVVELRLRKPAGGLQFLLYPMIHVGRPEFYREVARRLSEADLIVAEGVGDSATTDRLTSAYRASVENGELGLLVQDIDVESLGVPVLNPDFSGDQLDDRWSTIPAWKRGVMRAGIGCGPWSPGSGHWATGWSAETGSLWSSSDRMIRSAPGDRCGDRYEWRRQHPPDDGQHPREDYRHNVHTE